MVGWRPVGVAVIALAIASFVPVSNVNAAPREWNVVSTPDLGGGLLNGVACASASTCFMVGSILDVAQYRSTILQWNGARWVRSALEHRPSDSLVSVACPSATFCVAVGSWGENLPRRTLVETWDGVDWTVTPSPIDSPARNYLQSVSCAGPTSCVATGYSTDTQDRPLALAMVWDGVRWSVHDPAKPADALSRSLADVSCVTSTQCTAVGVVWQGLNRSVYITKWNGRRWHEVDGPAPNPRFRVLIGVDCRGRNECVAVGVQGRHSLMERRNGSTWSMVRGIDTGAHISELTAVTCPSARRCLAVGDAGPHWKRVQPLIQSELDGTWSQLSAPTAKGAVELLDVACASVDRCFAVAVEDVEQHDTPLVFTGPA